MSMRPRYPLTLTAAIFWMVFVLLIYYWIHKPLTVTSGRALAGAFLDIASALLMTTIAAGLGRTLLHWFHPQWPIALSTGEHIGGEALLGLGLLANLILFAGLLWLHALSVGLLLLVLTLLTYRALFSWLQDVWQLAQGLRELQTWDRALAMFIGFHLALSLVMALAPPTKFDSLTYHLVGPKHWLAEGRFVSLPGNHFFGFPQLINTLFAGQMALWFGRLTGAAMLHWVFGLLTLIAVGSYGAHRFSLRIGLLAVAILLSATSFWLEFALPYVDLPPVGFVFVAYLALEQWLAAQPAEGRAGQRWLVIAGIGIGLAMSVKYPLVGVGVAAGLYILVYSPRPQLLQNGFVLVGVAALVLAPWLVRNWAFYDNPVYPYGPLTGEWDQYHRQWYASIHDSMLFKTAWLWFTAPLSSTFLGFDGSGGYAATLGPLFLLLLPMLLITWRGLAPEPKRHIKEMAVFATGVAAMWLFMAAISIYGSQTRLWYAMFPMLALIAALALDSLRLLPAKPLNFHFVMSAMVALVLVLATVDNLRGTPSERGRIEGTTLLGHFLYTQSLDYLLGVIDTDEYLDHNLGWHIVAMREVNKLPDNAQIVFFWETKSLYCDEPRLTCLEDPILVRWWQQRRTIGTGSAKEIVERWHNDGITHILVWEKGREFEFDNNERFTEADKAEWARIPPLLQVVWQQDGEYTLYRLGS
jgi:hypothetical protein